MNATTPPRACASARTCWQTVVLPDDSGPKISVIRPRGMPPTPSARSSAIEPVGIVSRTSFSRDPSFMIAPRPNCFSIVARAASTALLRSAVLRSAARSSVIAICPSRSSSDPSDRSPERTLAPPVDQACSVSSSTTVRSLRGLRITSTFCGGSDMRRQTRLGALRLRLLLGLFVGPISRAHRFASASSSSLPIDPSRRLPGDFTAAYPARAKAQFGHRSGECSGPDRGSDPGHEV